MRWGAGAAMCLAVAVFAPVKVRFFSASPCKNRQQNNLGIVLASGDIIYFAKSVGYDGWS